MAKKGKYSKANSYTFGFIVEFNIQYYMIVCLVIVIFYYCSPSNLVG